MNAATTPSDLWWQLPALPKTYGGIEMQTEDLDITGMTCGGCTDKVTQALKAIAGVANVVVSLTSGVASVDYDEDVTSVGRMKSAIRSAGYGVGATGAVAGPFSKGGCCG